VKLRSPIPAAARDMHMALLATSGAGKTTAAKGLAEDTLEAKRRMAVVDPTGVWYGLRTMADGKPGFPVLIVGGKHGDLPLNPKAGAAHAKLIAGQNLPVIFDVLLTPMGQRNTWFADFAEALMAENDAPLQLFIDECHLFMPQNPPRDREGEAVRCMYAANNLVSGGRARGIATVLISQRAAKVNKDSLTQVQTIVAMQNVHALDRKTVDEYVRGSAGKEVADRIEASLPKLQTGEGWIYSPKLDVLDQVRFPMIRTLDTSDRPKDGAIRPPPASLKSINLAAIAAALKPAATADDEAAERAVKKKPAAAANAAKLYTPQQLDAVWKAGFKAGRLAERASLRRAIVHAIDMLPDDAAEPLSPLAQRMLDALQAKPLSSSELRLKLGRKALDGRWFAALNALTAGGHVVKDGERFRVVTPRRERA
jgi:uncharacterized protein